MTDAIEKVARPEGDDMTDPDFSAQTAEPMSQDEMREWLSFAAAEFRARGAVHIQASWKPGHEPPIYLVEGWMARPEVQPEPQFHMEPTRKEVLGDD